MCLPDIPAQLLVFHILRSRMRMAAKWDKSPTSRKRFILIVFLYRKFLDFIFTSFWTRPTRPLTKKSLTIWRKIFDEFCDSGRFHRFFYVQLLQCWRGIRWSAAIYQRYFYKNYQIITEKATYWLFFNTFVHLDNAGEF